MDTVTYSDFSEKLSGYWDQVNVDRTPLLVTRQDHSPVVVMSLDDFKAYEETFYLLSSQRNAERLNKAFAKHSHG
ncbi:MAG: type II toxin-antitoxin system prevent-host-death family antitoxin [Cyanobacteria bacterium P01_F01_bin.150]